MKTWEVLDAQGQPTGVRLRLPRRVAEQFLRPGETLREIEGPAIQPSRPIGRAPRVLSRPGSAAIRAKRARLRARLEGGAAQFTRQALLELIRSGALDGMEEP